MFLMLILIFQLLPQIINLLFNLLFCCEILLINLFGKSSKRKLQILESRKNKKLEEIKQRNRSRSKSNPKKFKNIVEDFDLEENQKNGNENSEQNRNNNISCLNKSKDHSKIERNKSARPKSSLKNIMQEKNFSNNKNFRKNISKEDLNFKNNLNNDLNNINNNLNYVSNPFILFMIF